MPSAIPLVAMSIEADGTVAVTGVSDRSKSRPDRAAICAAVGAEQGGTARCGAGHNDWESRYSCVRDTTS